ncbi:MAG: hypothetical protein WDW38_004606 [Sanguina aurantia]
MKTQVVIRRLKQGSSWDQCRGPRSPFRPVYPQHMFDSIFAFAQLPPRHTGKTRSGTCIDIATGSGQALGPLAAQFARVLALDCSETQIKEARACAPGDVEFIIGDAHQTQLPGRSADLITVGQALHWMELRDFYTEARRLLKPSGALAAWTYDHGQYQDAEGVPLAAVNDVMAGNFERLRGYWDARRLLVDNRYQGMDPLDNEFKTVERHTFTMTRPASVDAVVGSVSSWSAYGTYRRRHPTGVDPLVKLRSDLSVAVSPGAGAASGQPAFRVMHTITLILAKEPVPVAAE